jgi:hypothetical protein
MENTYSKNSSVIPQKFPIYVENLKEINFRFHALNEHYSIEHNICYVSRTVVVICIILVLLLRAADRNHYLNIIY